MELGFVKRLFENFFETDDPKLAEVIVDNGLDEFYFAWLREKARELGVLEEYEAELRKVETDGQAGIVPEDV